MANVKVTVVKTTTTSGTTISITATPNPVDISSASNDDDVAIDWQLVSSPGWSFVGADQGVKIHGSSTKFKNKGGSNNWQNHQWVRNKHQKDGNSYKQIATAVPSIKISEHLPTVAKEMKDMAIIRSMSTGDGNHQTGNYLMHTGFRIGSGGGLVHPSLGAIVANQLGKDEDELPNFVSVGNTRGPGHLGPKYAPLQVSANSKGLPDIRTAGSQDEVDANASLVNELNDAFLKDYQAPAMSSQKTTLQRAVALMKSGKTAAFNTDNEPASARDAYGKSNFGAGCLLARRLIEGGVKFVEVSLGGWTRTRTPTAR